MTQTRRRTTSTRECPECGWERVVSKREFSLVYNASAVAASREREVFRGLKRLFPPKSRGKGAATMLKQFLDRTPKGDPTHICTKCYTPTFFRPSGDVKSHGPDYDPQRDPDVSSDASAFM